MATWKPRPSIARGGLWRNDLSSSTSSKVRSPGIGAGTNSVAVASIMSRSYPLSPLVTQRLRLDARVRGRERIHRLLARPARRAAPEGGLPRGGGRGGGGGG